jgi:hypothetical protein
VRDGRHRAEDAVLARYRGVLAAIGASGIVPVRSEADAGDDGQGMGRAA